MLLYGETSIEWGRVSYETGSPATHAWSFIHVQSRRPPCSAFASARRFASWHLCAQTELIFAAVQHHISDSSAPRTAPRSSQGSVCVCLPACVVCRCTRIAAVGNQSLQEYPCCDQPAPPGVFQGGAACLRHYTAPGVPKVECVRAFLFRASAPRSVPR